MAHEVRSQNTDIFRLAEQYELDHPEISEMMGLLGVSLEQIAISLAHLYPVRFATSSSTEELHANLE